MKTKKLQFKTTLNCNGCVSRVKDDLDHAKGIKEWNVDLKSNDRLLTVESEGITPDEIVALLEKKGYKATGIEE